MRIRNLAAVWLGFTWACQPTETGSPSKTEVHFAPYLAPCPGPGVQAYPCLVDLSGGETYPTGTLRGLDFEWGVGQRVRLVGHVKEDPSVDTASWAWDVDSVLSLQTRSSWSFLTTLDDASRWKIAGDTLRIEGYGFPIAVPIAADRERMRTGSGASIFELEVTPANEAGNTDGPALQGKLQRVRERPVPG